MVDLNNFIDDEKLLSEITRRENFKANLKKQLQNGDHEEEDEGIPSKASMKSIIQYVEASYMGDSDFFAFKYNLDDRGRDTTAIAQRESTVFIMGKEEIDKIAINFPSIY